MLHEWPQRVEAWAVDGIEMRSVIRGSRQRMYESAATAWQSQKDMTPLDTSLALPEGSNSSGFASNLQSACHMPRYSLG